MTVAAILKQKGSEITSVEPTRTIAEVAQVLSTKRIGAVLVMDSAKQLLGILTERDLLHALAAHGARTLDMTAGQLMTRSLTTATPETTEVELMEMMTHGRFRHLPVLDKGKLIGLVSIGDAVKARISQTEHEVDSLRAYVSGSA
jgi:CBS domain-containing protein